MKTLFVAVLAALTLGITSPAFADSFIGGRGPAGPPGPAGADGADGSPGAPGYSANSITSGCGVVYSGSGLTYTVAPCAVSIGGTTYTVTTETSITLDEADGSNPRIDLIVATSSSTVTKVSGTAAASPAAPELDPATQVQLSFVTVGAGATTPSNVSTEIIYDENNDWTCTASDASNVCNSTTNPHAGTTTIEGTSVANNDYVELVDGDGTFALTTYNTISLYLRSKATWSAHSTLTLQWYNSTTKVGSEVVIRPTDTFEFTSSDTTTHQLLVIPTSLFGTGGTSVDRIRFTKKGSGTIGYYLDDIKLQGGVQSTIVGTADMQWRGTWTSTANYLTNQVVSHDGSSYVALANNTNVTPGTDAATWTEIGGAGGGAAWRISTRSKALDPCTSTEQARPTTRNNHPVLGFESGTGTTRECACFEDVLPTEYAGGGITAKYFWMAANATSGATVWEGYVERQDDDAIDLDSDSFAAAQSVTATAASVSGELAYDTITFTDGAQMDSLAAGERFRFKVCRDADNAADTMSNDAQLVHVTLTETP